MEDSETLQSVSSIQGKSVYDDSEEEQSSDEEEEINESPVVYNEEAPSDLANETAEGGETEAPPEDEATTQAVSEENEVVAQADTENGTGEEEEGSSQDVLNEGAVETTNTNEQNNYISNDDDYLEYRTATTEGTNDIGVEEEENREENGNGGEENTEETERVDTYEQTEDQIQETNEEGYTNTQDEEVNTSADNEYGFSNKADTVRFAKVTIVHSEMIKKPFLGGFKNKETGVEYHNASTQTYRPPTEKELRKRSMIKFHREAQTVDVAYQTTQPKRETSTQMTKPGVYVSADTDKVLVARPYFTAAELHDLKIKKAVKIQCMVRKFFAKRKVRTLRQEKQERQQGILQQQEAKRQEAADLRIQEIERRRNPRTKEDFNILYKELEAWRKQETARIEAQNLSSEERKAVMYALLQKETKLLQTIDKLKQNASAVNKHVRIESNLDKMANPKEWGALGGQTTAVVETPFTKRAQELRELYNALKAPLLTIDQRLDVLLHVKWTAKEFDCRLTRDIIELIDREADLLNRGRSEKSVEGLRQRILSLFLQFIETPEFNPEAARLKFVPSTSAVVK